MLRLRHVKTFAAILPILLATASGPRVSLHPGIAMLGRPAAIVVTGIDAPSLQARLAGASTTRGGAFPWTQLRLANGRWRGTLPAPELRGIYPVELRIRPGAPVLHSRSWLLRVFARGTLARPSFATPEDVARWWVRSVPGRTLVAMKRWPPPTFDRRDTRLHQLLVLAYSLPDRPAVRDRLGIFVTAVRDGFDGKWRLLEATTVP
jgi:hypothetical protein